jgi:hypothetical protein
MMETLNPANEPCLTPEELNELRQRWRTLQAALGPLGSLLEGTEAINCEELYTLFLQLGDDFEEFEHSIMRSKQVRMLQASRGDQST